MIGWLSPVFLLSWIAVIVTGKRAQQSLATLDQAKQQPFRHAPTGELRPAVLLNAVIRGQYQVVDNPKFVRSCTAYRLALYGYFATLGALIIAIDWTITR